jgi:hypothetical protein
MVFEDGRTGCFQHTNFEKKTTILRQGELLKIGRSLLFTTGDNNRVDLMCVFSKNVEEQANTTGKLKTSKYFRYAPGIIDGKEA